LEIDWLKLWQELIVFNSTFYNEDQIKRYKKHTANKKERPDPLLDFMLKNVDSGMTVLDIGPGNGRWTIPLAKAVRCVTVVEPAQDMASMLRKNTRAAGVDVKIIASSWEETVVEPHDVVVCAHAMYNSPDLALFVRKMEQNARESCYLSIRMPPVDGIIGELSRAIYGRIYDSPNAMIAINALYFLGIYPNVLVENNIHYWTNDTLEEAFIRAKKHLHLATEQTHDNLILKTLEKRLSYSNNHYTWPDGMRSALLWWKPANEG
jgi:2-polyprenyl-3-methyl-5-hydroxy-6-metoxy-1,4-benzoquinol methylase